VDPEKRITANEALDHPYFDSLREKYRGQSEQRSLKRSFSDQHFPVQSIQATERNLSESMERSQISQNDLTSKSRANSLSLSGSNKSSYIDIEPKQPNSELYHKQLLSTSRENEEFLNFAMREANLESQYP